MEKKHRVVVIGAGDMGRNHVLAWQNRPDAQVVAVCDVDLAAAQALAARYGVAAYNDYGAALERSDAGIASVCVPVHLHRAVAEGAFRAGCHVLLEKPIAGTLADARAIGDAARTHGRRLVVSYQYRGFFGFRKLKQWLGARAARGPLFMRCSDVREVRPKRAMHHRSMNGGPIVDMCGHLFDMARHLFAVEPQTVTARGHVGGADKPRLAGIMDPAIDTAEILVGFPGGHTLSVFVNWGMPEGFPAAVRYELSGGDFQAAVDTNTLQITTAAGTQEWTAERDTSGPACRMEDLIRSIEDGTDPELSAEEASRALAVSLAALRSIETGMPVGVEKIVCGARRRRR